MTKERVNSNVPSILMIGPLPPPIHGSAMMTQFIKDSHLINNTLNLDWVNLSTSRNMSEIGKWSPKKILRFLNSYFKTFYKLCTKQYQLCYLAITCHGTGFIKDAPFALICKLFSHKIVIHQHNKGMHKDVDKPLFRFLLKKVYKNTEVILLSERLYPDIAEIVNKSQVLVCPNGIPDAPRYDKKDSPKPRLLFLSNLLESKGVLDLLDACKILKEKEYEFTCDFIGSETKEIDKERFQKELSDRGLEDVVSYLGKKFGEDKYKEFANSQIFILPTKNECFPLVLLEAMQQGVACIATDVGGIPDIIEDKVNGIIIRKDNVDDLVKAISALIDNPKLCKKFGEKGYQKYKDLFTIQKFEERIKNILQK